MDLDFITRAAALIAVLGTAVVYGTDVFCAIVLRPALGLVDDHALVAVTGSVHRYGDRRMPVPGVLGVLATATTAVLATVAAQWAQAIAAGAALVLLLVWIVLYTRVSAPINRQLTAAADAGIARSPAAVRDGSLGPPPGNLQGIRGHHARCVDRAERRRESTRRADPIPTGRRPRGTRAALHGQPRIRR